MEQWEIVLGNFASDRSDFDAADGDNCEHYYSDDDGLFSLDDFSCSELCDIRTLWNTQTRVQEDMLQTEIITENGPKSGNSDARKEDHSKDENGEIPKGVSIAHH